MPEPHITEFNQFNTCENLPLVPFRVQIVRAGASIAERVLTGMLSESEQVRTTMPTIKQEAAAVEQAHDQAFNDFRDRLEQHRGAKQQGDFVTEARALVDVAYNQPAEAEDDSHNNIRPLTPRYDGTSPAYLKKVYPYDTGFQADEPTQPIDTPINPAEHQNYLERLYGELADAA